MKTIAHISDLHFGSQDPALVEALVDEVAALRPAVVAISGELTQRARRREFLQARAFLDRLPVPVIAVPGNHDIPLFNLYRRFFAPVAKFRRHVSADLTPLYADDEIAVLGINSARSNVFKEGRIAHRQIELLHQRLDRLAPQVLKILVVHHPFIPHPDDPRRTMVKHGAELLAVAEESGLDLILAGHTHLGYGDDVRSLYQGIERSILVFQAGTATARSLRGGESNSYNLVTVDGSQLGLEVRAWDGGGFVTDFTIAYRREGDEWRRGYDEAGGGSG